MTVLYELATEYLKKHGGLLLFLSLALAYFYINLEKSREVDHLRMKSLEIKVDELQEKYVTYLLTDGKEARAVILKNNELLEKIENKLK